MAANAPCLFADDGDSWTDVDGDCNDLDATVYPGAGDEVDQSIDDNSLATVDGGSLHEVEWVDFSQEIAEAMGWNKAPGRCRQSTR